MLKDYPRTLVIPETLFLLAEVNFYEGKAAEGNELLRRLSVDYGYTEWGRRGERTPAGAEVRIVHDIVDLRSDTLTLPDAGDAGGRPARPRRRRRLGGGSDSQAAGSAGRRASGEGSRFVASGTMGNLICVLSHTRRPGSRPRPGLAHLQLRGRGRAVIGNVQMRPVKTARGF